MASALSAKRNGLGLWPRLEAVVLGVIGHVVLALVMQQLIDRGSGSRVAGAAAAIAWAIAREVTQAEYRWIERFGAGLRINMPWWGGLDPRVWSHVDPWLDWLMPTVVVLAVMLWRRRQHLRSATPDDQLPV